MNEMLLIYLVTTLDSILTLLFIFAFAGMCIAPIMCVSPDVGDWARLRRAAKILAIPTAVLVLLIPLIPITKQASAMIAGSILLDVAKSEKARTLSDTHN